MRIYKIISKIYAFLAFLPVIGGVSCSLLCGVKSESPDGEMIQEWVYIKQLTTGEVTTAVDYILRGNFERKKIIAFPETEWFELKNFKARWNSQPLSIEKERAPHDGFFTLGGSRFSALYKMEISSYGGELHELHNEYSYSPPYYAPPASKSEKSGPGGKYIEYILVTGAAWENKIRRVEATFLSGTSCDKIHELEDSYHGECADGVWKFIGKNMEPDRNIRLVVE